MSNSAVLTENVDFPCEKLTRLEVQSKVPENLIPASNLGFRNDAEIRLLLNNTEMGCEIEPNIILYGMAGFNPPSSEEMYQVLSSFTKRGDVLARKILNETNRIGEKEMWLVLKDNNILPELIARKMTQEEYVGYLKGETPLGKRDGEDYYLSRGP